MIRSTTGAPACAVLATAMVVLCGAAAAASPAAAIGPEEALLDVNAWRSLAGIPAVSTFTPEWNDGCDKHNGYQALNGGDLTHSEQEGSPGYTPEGASAGSTSVLSGGELAPSAAWDDAVFHRTSVLQPRLRSSGFAASHGSTCMRVFGGIDDTSAARTPAVTLYPWPSHGLRDVPAEGIARGVESPDPYTVLPPGLERAGYLISVNVNGPWDSFLDPQTTVTSASLTPDGGAPVPLTVCDVSCERGRSLDGGFGLFPHQPLAEGTWYTAHAFGLVRADGVEHPFEANWRFQTIRLDPQTDVDFDDRYVRVESRSPATVHVTIASSPSARQAFQRGLAPGSRVEHGLSPGRYTLCYRQDPDDRFRDTQPACEEEIAIEGRARLKLSKGRARGRRVRFRLTASGYAPGQRAYLATLRPRRRCYRGVNPVTGRGVRSCRRTLTRVGRERALTLRQAQTLTTSRPRRGDRVQLRVRTKRHRSPEGGIWQPATARRTYRR